MHNSTNNSIDNSSLDLLLKAANVATTHSQSGTTAPTTTNTNTEINSHVTTTALPSDTTILDRTATTTTTKRSKNNISVACKSCKRRRRKCQITIHHVNVDVNGSISTSVNGSTSTSVDGSTSASVDGSTTFLKCDYCALKNLDCVFVKGSKRGPKTATIPPDNSGSSRKGKKKIITYATRDVNVSDVDNFATRDGSAVTTTVDAPVDNCSALTTVDAPVDNSSAIVHNDLDDISNTTTATTGIQKKRKRSNSTSNATSNTISNTTVLDNDNTSIINTTTPYATTASRDNNTNTAPTLAAANPKRKNLTLDTVISSAFSSTTPPLSANLNAAASLEYINANDVHVSIPPSSSAALPIPMAASAASSTLQIPALSFTAHDATYFPTPSTSNSMV